MKHLLDIDDLDADDLLDLLDLAEDFAEVQKREMPKVPALRGRTIVLAFFEDSTRTRTSFDLAARRLSADVINFAASSSSLKKGESLRDTIETIAAMGIDAIVVRHGSSGAPQQITRWTDATVINAGDGWHQHPTQALLDSFTIRRRLGTLAGKRVIICGDIKHSRVARSNISAFTKLGAEVTVVAPGTLLPVGIDRWPVRVATRLEPLLPEADVAYFLRIQHERMSPALLPSDREFRTLFGLTVERARLLPDHALIMHPGPMNRGVEVDAEVADDPRSVILDQVTNGVAVRMAVLFRTVGPGRFEVDEPVNPAPADPVLANPVLANPVRGGGNA
ncbi:MAG: aspartate carbamoyltransferase catalytic subunit [Actinomycetota bacterium]|nr:aspartate carbamoyltransferase catalytic subunit [Actinomycetota bacterium]